MSGFPKVIILAILVIFLMATVSAAENTTEVTSLDENSLEEVNETLSEDFGEDSSQNISITFDEQMYEKNLTDICLKRMFSTEICKTYSKLYC